MDIKHVRELVELMIDKDLAELELEQHGVRLRLRRPEQIVAAAAPMAAGVPYPAPAQAAPTEQGASAPEPSHAGAHMIKSPMVGTFYASPDPDSDPFVQVGDRVEEGQTLCIIEAMKLMNEITADVSGEVVAVLQQNGQPVEYGQELFAIRAG